jgi:hypothetical protein
MFLWEHGVVRSISVNWICVCFAEIVQNPTIVHSYDWMIRQTTLHELDSTTAMQKHAHACMHVMYCGTSCPHVACCWECAVANAPPRPQSYPSLCALEPNTFQNQFENKMNLKIRNRIRSHNHARLTHQYLVCGWVWRGVRGRGRGCALAIFLFLLVLLFFLLFAINWATAAAAATTSLMAVATWRTAGKRMDFRKSQVYSFTANLTNRERDRCLRGLRDRDRWRRGDLWEYTTVEKWIHTESFFVKISYRERERRRGELWNHINILECELKHVNKEKSIPRARSAARWSVMSHDFNKCHRQTLNRIVTNRERDRRRGERDRWRLWW